MVLILNGSSLHDDLQKDLFSLTRTERVYVIKSLVEIKLSILYLGILSKTPCYLFKMVTQNAMHMLEEKKKFFLEIISNKRLLSIP